MHILDIHTIELYVPYDILRENYVYTTISQLPAATYGYSEKSELCTANSLYKTDFYEVSYSI